FKGAGRVRAGFMQPDRTIDNRARTGGGSMTRTLTDDAGNSWSTALTPSNGTNEEVDEEMVMRFVPESDAEAECEIRIVGPAVEPLPRLGKPALRMALEAAQNALGFLFLDRDDRLWWVQSAREDPVADGAALTFVRDTDELRHAGPLPAPPGELTE